MLFKVLLFACIGVAMEVVFTAVLALPASGDLRLMGYSYIWMLPIYGLVPVILSRLYPRLARVSVPVRLTVYVAILFGVEYASGWTLRLATGTCPWEAGYHGHRWAVSDLIRLDFAPAWALAAFIFERIYVALLSLP